MNRPAFVWLGVNRPTRADPIVTRDQCLTLANVRFHMLSPHVILILLKIRLDSVASLTIRTFLLDFIKLLYLLQIFKKILLKILYYD